MRLFAILALASCATPLSSECVTRCGTRIVSEYLPTAETGWTCEGLQEAEDVLVALVADKYPRACAALDVTIKFHPGESFSFVGSKVYGLTHCSLRQVELSSLDLRVSAYAHEMLHVIQGCALAWPIDYGQDLAHADWDRNGFNNTILKWQEAVW